MSEGCVISFPSVLFCLNIFSVSHLAESYCKTSAHLPLTWMTDIPGRRKAGKMKAQAQIQHPPRVMTCRPTKGFFSIKWMENKSMLWFHINSPERILQLSCRSNKHMPWMETFVKKLQCTRTHVCVFCLILPEKIDGPVWMCYFNIPTYLLLALLRTSLLLSRQIIWCYLNIQTFLILLCNR